MGAHSCAGSVLLQFLRCAPRRGICSERAAPHLQLALAQRAWPGRRWARIGTQAVIKCVVTATLPPLQEGDQFDGVRLISEIWSELVALLCG